MIPVLTFHALVSGSGPIYFPPDSFMRAAQQWHAAGWNTISLYEAVRCVRERAPFPARSFVLTFDDGYASVYRVAFPLLQQYNWTATVFVALGEHDSTHGDAPLPPLFNGEMLRWNEIREMRAHGVTFGAHTLTHPDLTRIDHAQAEYEMRVSQSILADALGEAIPLFAYPFGRFNARVWELAARYFQAAVSDRLGLMDAQSDLFALERVETFYLKADWAAAGMTRPWFKWYLDAVNVPRSARRVLTNFFL